MASCRDGQHSRAPSRGNHHSHDRCRAICATRWVHAIPVTPGSRASTDGSGVGSVPPGSWSTTPPRGSSSNTAPCGAIKAARGGSPGGALHQGEEAIHGALREAREEAAVPPGNLRVLFTSVFDVGYWSYTTVVALALQPFEAAISDAESIELQWVGVDGVGGKELHPGFAAAWPGLRSRLTEARRIAGRL